MSAIVVYFIPVMATATPLDPKGARRFLPWLSPWGRSAAFVMMADAPATEGLTLTLGHLYPEQLNIYGDRGNILTLQQRCRWRDITLRIVSLDLGDSLDPTTYDLLFIGGGQDKEQNEVARDLRERKAEALRTGVEAGLPVLAVCGGYQLLAHFYRPAEGPELPG